MTSGVKKMKRFSSLRSYITLLCCLFIPATLLAQEELTIATWGGSYEKAQMTTIFEPFEEVTGNQIDTQNYSGGLAILNGDLIPDVIDMTLSDSLLACEQKLIKKMPFSKIMAKDKSVRNIKKDFTEGAILPCGVAHLSYSTLIAYDEIAFSGEKPQTIADFFDIKRFPGKRAIHKEPAAILEWAMMAEGVPIDQIYDLLSTERGMRLAFRRLDSIKEHIIWWENAKEPAALLKSKKAVMVSGYNGRFFEAQIQGAAISMIWDGQIVDWNVWAVPNKKKIKSETINAFIQFATQSENMARLAEQIPYGPSRISALKRVGLHPTKGFAMRGHLPTAPHHLDRALFRDSRWYARTQAMRNDRFWAWLNAKD